MIDTILALSIRHRAWVLCATVCLAACGVYAVRDTPVDAIPDVSEDQVLVLTPWPGHSPREVEEQITAPLSAGLRGLAGVRVVRGSSDVDFSLIHVILSEGVSISDGRSRVQEALARRRGELPADARPDLAPDGQSTGQIFWYTVEGDGYDLAALRDVQDWSIRPQLQAVPGVAEVASVGGHVREYHVQLDPQRLLDQGVTLRAIHDELHRANAAVGAGVIHKSNAEYVVRGVGWLGAADGRSGSDASRVMRDLEQTVVPAASGGALLSRLGTVSLGVRPRRGVLEKDGNEVVGGVVHLRTGHNPLRVTQAVRARLRELRPGLPPGVRIVPCYDRTPLIRGAIQTVTGTVIEAMLISAICVWLVLRHMRTAAVITVTLPLAALGSFALLWVVRHLGIARVETNIMSLAGIAISIGVLVDSSIVMAENVLFHLREHFGDRPVTGDVRPIVLAACRGVGAPILGSVLIMLLSFLPVFALEGLDGKLFRPLAFTKTLALLTVAGLSLTVVPALCTICARGRVPDESDSWVVRSVTEVYRPVLAWLLERPAVLWWGLMLALIAACAPWGNRTVSLAVLFVALATSGCGIRSSRWRWTAMSTLVLGALITQSAMSPLGCDVRLPLDEGMVMDMPVTVPRASVVEATDDLKARDMVLCRFPEVAMVVGKAGRAETAFDPAPLDMIESMVEFRPHALWPRRKISTDDAQRMAGVALAELVAAGCVAAPTGSRADFLQTASQAALFRFDGVSREFAHQRQQDFLRRQSLDLTADLVRSLAGELQRQGQLARELLPGDVSLTVQGVPPALREHLVRDTLASDSEAFIELVLSRWHDLHLIAPAAGGGSLLPRVEQGTLADSITLTAKRLLDRAWPTHVRELNAQLASRAAPTFARIVCEALLERAAVQDPRLDAWRLQVDRARRGELRAEASRVTDGSEDQSRASKSIDAAASTPGQSSAHHGGPRHGPLPVIDPLPELDAVFARLATWFDGHIGLRVCERSELTRFGELDESVRMPGWTNVWTMPIQNRVDMLATGVNTELGVRVQGDHLETIVEVSEAIADVLRRVPGAAGVMADPIRGKGYLEIRPNREAAARWGVSVSDIHDAVEAALNGRIATWSLEGRERHAIRIGWDKRWSRDELTLRDLPVAVHALRGADGAGDSQGETSPSLEARNVRLADVADLAIVEGPATIKSENGTLRNYVRLNVRDRDILDFLHEARAAAATVPLPRGVHLEWTGQYEHTLQTRRRLWLLTPFILAAIVAILYLTYGDWADAGLMLLAVPGALAGGILCQWICGYRFSIPVAVGYIACLGMATSTGIIMLVYLREAVARAGGLERLDREGLKQAVLRGAVHRLRPKLLTEGTTILGLAPLLWATGPGADVIRPMAAPVLGGILIADEVIDLLIPVLFFLVRTRRLANSARRGEVAT